MKIIAFDPSGNFKEGKGTTGVCIMEDGVPKRLDSVAAKDFPTALDYWDYIIGILHIEQPDHVVCEGYRLYHHKGKEAKMQANSDLETPQLVGVIKYQCYLLGIPCTIQYAHEVKNRWSEDVLVRLGILEKKGNRFYWNGKSTVTHHRDALKHALHFDRYKKEKL